MAARKHTKTQEHSPTSKPEASTAPDLLDILERFSDALDIVRVTARSLAFQEIGAESSALDIGVAALDRVYTDLDMVIQRLSRS